MKMHRLTTILVLTLLSLNARSAIASVESTYSVHSVTMRRLDTWIDKDTLVLIELDDVLSMPKSRMFHYNDNPYRLFIENLVSMAKQDSKYLKLISNWYQSRKIMLVQEGWKEFIHNLQAQGVQVYGFCTMPIHLQNIEYKRFLEIKELGIVFNEKIGNRDVIPLNQKEGWSAVFYHGIIFTGPFSKTQTLLDFMKITSISPKKILVIDKTSDVLGKPHLLSLNLQMKPRVLVYLGARKHDDKPDPKIVQRQQETLLKQGRWLEDDEVVSE